MTPPERKGRLDLRKSPTRAIPMAEKTEQQRPKQETPAPKSDEEMAEGDLDKVSGGIPPPDDGSRQ